MLLRAHVRTRAEGGVHLTTTSSLLSSVLLCKQKLPSGSPGSCSGFLAIKEEALLLEAAGNGGMGEKRSRGELPPTGPPLPCQDHDGQLWVSWLGTPQGRGAGPPIRKLAKQRLPTELFLLSSGGQADVGMSKVGGCKRTFSLGEEGHWECWGLRHSGEHHAGSLLDLRGALVHIGKSPRLDGHSLAPVTWWRREGWI